MGVLLLLRKAARGGLRLTAFDPAALWPLRKASSKRGKLLSIQRIYCCLTHEPAIREFLADVGREIYNQPICCHTGNALLLQEHPYGEDTLESYLELMVEVCCSRRDFTRISGDDIPTGVVKSRFSSLVLEYDLS